MDATIRVFWPRALELHQQYNSVFRIKSNGKTDGNGTERCKVYNDAHWKTGQNTFHCCRATFYRMVNPWLYHTACPTFPFQYGLQYHQVCRYEALGNGYIQEYCELLCRSRSKNGATEVSLSGLNCESALSGWFPSLQRHFASDPVMLQLLTCHVTWRVPKLPWFIRCSNCFWMGAILCWMIKADVGWYQASHI